MSPTSPEASEEDSPGTGPQEWKFDSGAEAANSIELGSPAGSGKSATDAEDKSHAETEEPSVPVQKRRRVTRACDECRRKKIKCDGKQPCTHCSVYSYECTYDKPSNRRRNPAPQYVEALENRLQRAEAMLRKYIPDLDLSDPDLDPAIKQEFRNRELARAQAAKLKQSQAGLGMEGAGGNGQILSMIESIGQLDLDDDGEWDFHGASSGAVFLRRMKEHFRGMLGPPEKAPFLPRPEKPAGIVGIDSPQSGASSSYGPSSAHPLELPSKEEARELCYYSLNCATCLIRIVHIPSFYESLDAIYEKPIDSLQRDELHFLGLLYCVFALGCMYRNLDPTKPQQMAYREAVQEGLQYHSYAKIILGDLTEARDVTSLQAIIFMILFLQSTSNLSACYALLGIALRSALRMGLHRHLHHRLMSPIEQEVRRRIFYVVRQMDIYVSTLLGFPLLLHNEDIDQRYPTEVDDEYVRQDAILAPPPGTPSIFEAFNAHTRLMEILAKIVRHVYPMQGIDEATSGGESPTTSYVISYARIKEIERDLHEWYSKLPEMWRPSTEGPIEVVRIRHLLRFAYAHVQLVLYRPFLHYVSPRLSRGKKIDELSYACAAAAISVSRNIIHIGVEIRKQGALIGPYWVMLYTEFFAILSLVFYATENPQKHGTAEVLADAIAGKDMISDYIERSLAAERVSKALDVLFGELPKRMEKYPLPQPVPTRKRPMRTKDDTAGPSAGKQRRPDEIPRPRTVSASTSMSQAQSATTSTSFDTLSMTNAAGFSAQDPFASLAQDMLPLDMSTRLTPESTSSGAGGGGGLLSQAFGATSQATMSSSLNKLNALMFPSEDPFAYPNQPMMELGLQQQQQQQKLHTHTDALPGQDRGQQDPTQFFMGGGSSGGEGAGGGGGGGGGGRGDLVDDVFGDVESQLLGQMPPFMMDHQHQGLESMPMHMFGAGSSAGTSSGAASSGGGGREATGRDRLEALRRQQEQILVAQRFQADWGPFGRGPGFEGL